MVEIKNRYIYYFVLIVANLVYFYRLFLGDLTFDIGGDAYGHLFKVYRVCLEPTIQWDMYWYVGYPIFLYYPPLFYYISLAFCPLGIFGIKLMLVLLTIISTLITFEISRKYTDDLTAFFATLYFHFSFFKLKSFNPEGNFPQYISILMFPVILLIAKRLEKSSLFEILLFSIFFGFMILLHHSSAVLAFIGFLILIIIFYKQKVFSLWRKVFFLLINSFIIASPFLIPFFLYNKYAYYLTYKDDGSLYNAYKVDPVEVLIYPTKKHWSSYLSPIIFFVGFPYNLISFLFSILSFGYPKFLIYNLPILNKMPLYRYLILSLFFTWVGLLFLKNKYLKYVSFSFILLNLYFVYMFQGFYEFKIPTDLQEIFHFINKQDGLYRVWIADYSIGSFISFHSVYTGKLNFEGWSRETNPIFWEFSEMRYYLMHSCEILPNFYKYGVRYLVIKKNVCNNLLLNKVFETDSYVVYEYKNYAFIHPKVNYEIKKFGEETIIEVKNISGGYYEISIGYNPLWHVYLDEKEINKSRSESGLIRIYIPKGDHIIKLKFEGTNKYYIIPLLYVIFISILLKKYK